MINYFSLSNITFPSIAPRKALSISVSSWVVIALLGQWIFAFYIFARYALPLVTGQIENVNLAPSITGVVRGDTLGNAMLFFHVIPAALLSFSGVLQLIPKIRTHYPSLHRWNGRLFLTLGIIGALGGLYLTWGRGSRFSDIGALGITLNGLLIPVAAVMAWRFAVTKNFSQHKRWAIHAFILVNGVWTFRLYLMAWYLVNQGPRGNNQQLDGPTDIAISFACYLLPMAVAECVFWAKRQSASWRIWAVSGVMSAGCVITLLGIIAATLFMWLPRTQLAFGLA